MEELKRTREETEKTREELGAVDVMPGEVEGMIAPEKVRSKGSRAMEKRKRELEERRKMLDAKRRKKDPQGDSVGTSSKVDGPTEEREDKPFPSQAKLFDPFEALEAESRRDVVKGKHKETRQSPEQNAADAFLAALEQDILKKNRR